MNKKRWLIYFFVGIVFGVFDFYYQGPVQNIKNDIVLVVMVLGIWVVVALPVAIYEAKVSRAAWKAALATMFTWVVAVVSYYLYLLVKVMFIGEPGRPDLHISNRADPYYRLNILATLQSNVIGGILEWLLVAIIGGFIFGYLFGWIYLKAKPVKQAVK